MAHRAFQPTAFQHNAFQTVPDVVTSVAPEIIYLLESGRLAMRVADDIYMEL